MAPPGHKSSSFAGLPLIGKLFILVVLLGVLSAIYYFALHMSLADDIESAERRHAKLLDEREEAKEREQEYLRLSQELANRDPIDRRNKRILPEKAEIASFLQDLNRLGELSGLSLRLVEPRPEEAEQLLVRIPVSLQLGGEYHQIMKFFYDVSRLDRAISMENITIGDPRTESDDGSEIVLDVAVQATTFRRRVAGDDAQADAKGKQKGAQASKRKGGNR